MHTVWHLKYKDTVNEHSDWMCRQSSDLSHSETLTVCLSCMHGALQGLTPLSRDGSARASVGVTPNWLRAVVKAWLVGTKTVAAKVGSLR